MAIARILAALEPLGLVSPVTCTSSYSSGLHLYFPFPEAQSCWELAIALASLLENAGFKLNPGQLEVFPNPKPYSVEGAPSLFNAHRLPLQSGSYLVNEDFQPVWSDRQRFVSQWHWAQQHNQLDVCLLKRTIKQAKRRLFRISGKADKFINDLNAEIELGWTGAGQTNHLLGRITMRAYIFQHVLEGGEPLRGAELVEQIVKVARSLPGYQEWCRHQHEIEQRAEEWARCIENSHYFHYGDQSGKYKIKTEESAVDPAIDQLPTWNQQQREATRERIRQAIADLLDQEKLPAGATARFQLLTRIYGIGGGSLYRHRDLWHPNFLEFPPNPPALLKAVSCNCAEAVHENNPTSLLSQAGGDNAPVLDSSDRLTLNAGSEGGNSQSSQTASPLASSAHSVRLALFDLTASLQARREAARLARAEAEQIRHQAYQVEYIARMRQYLESGDPILVAEALAWAKIHPTGLNLEAELPSVLPDG